MLQECCNFKGLRATPEIPMVQNGMQGTPVRAKSSPTVATVVALRGRKKGWPGHLGIHVLARVDGTALLVTSCVS